MSEPSDTRVEFRWPASLVAQVDTASGDVSRSLWVRRAVEKALATEAVDPSTQAAKNHAVTMAQMGIMSPEKAAAAYVKPFKPNPKGKA